MAFSILNSFSISYYNCVYVTEKEERGREREREREREN